MTPAHSEVLNPGDGPLTLDEARDSIGLWDDQSMDDHLETLLASATEYVRKCWGGPLGDEAVVAYFKAFAERLELPGSRPRRETPGFVSSSVPGLQYVDAAGLTRTATQDDYAVDGSGKYLVLRPSESLRQTPLSQRVDNPVMVSFTRVGITPEIERVKAAIRVTLMHLYKVGQGEMTMIPKDAVYTLLGRGYTIGAVSGTDSVYPEGEVAHRR